MFHVVYIPVMVCSVEDLVLEFPFNSMRGVSILLKWNVDNRSGKDSMRP